MPSDTYDRAGQGQNQSWGVIDDTCDGIVTADLVIDGRRFSAQARICVGPPDYAPDARPFVSLADDLADRDLDPAGADELLAAEADTQRRLADLFQRVWETASLVNVDAIRARALGDNRGFPPPPTDNLPNTDDTSMRPSDTPYADAKVAALIPEPPTDSVQLVFSTLVGLAHDQLAEEDVLVDFLLNQSERLRLMIRPAYGAFHQLSAAVAAGQAPDPAFRDPRVLRDLMHDMRMPPYIRDETASALGLTRRQYEELMVYVAAVRSLRPAPVTLVVTQRPALPPDQPAPPDQPPQTIQLDGWRRTYTDPRTGVIDATYQPGELTQSLCSPWQHDFRDCSCTYWASNHPDIVFPAVPRGEPTQPGGLPTDPAEQIRINWLRDPDVAEVHGQALPSQRDNRPFEASYFQINHRWQDLSIVLEGRETEGSYLPRSAVRDQAVPFPTNDELWDRIVELAGLEHLVTLLYLYALFSVIDPGQAPERGAGRWPTLADDVTFTRSVLLEVATSEMQHLRWANHLLWGLAGTIGHPYQPAVVPPALALPAPPGGAPRPAPLAPLTLGTLALFIDIERSSAYIDGQYARVTATLRQPGYPAHLYQLASNIAEEGDEHFLYFRDLQLLLSPYGEQDPVYLRPVSPGDPAQPDIGAALDDYRHILTLLETGYQLGDRQNQQALAEARTAMFVLQTRAEQLALQGHGIPFFAPWQ